MHLDRRQTALLGSSAFLTALSGCPGVPGLNQARLDLTVLDYTSEPQPLIVELLRVDESGYQEARVFRREFIPPAPSDGDSAGQVQEEDIAPKQRYLVRVLLRNGDGQWQHHHFYPGMEGSGSLEERVPVRVCQDDMTDELYVEFT